MQNLLYNVEPHAKMSIIFFFQWTNAKLHYYTNVGYE